MDNVADDLGVISTSYLAAAEKIRSVCGALLALMHSTPEEQRRVVLQDMPREISSCAVALADGLEGIQSMCSPISSLIAAQKEGSMPQEVVEGCLMNILSVFVTQMASFSSETSNAIANAKSSLTKLRSSNPSGTASQRLSSPSIKAPPQAGDSNDVRKEKEPVDPYLQPPSEAESQQSEVVERTRKKTKSRGDVPHVEDEPEDRGGVHKKKRSKKVARHDDIEDEEQQITPPTPSTPVALVSVSAAPQVQPIIDESDNLGDKKKKKGSKKEKKLNADVEDTTHEYEEREAPKSAPDAKKSTDKSKLESVVGSPLSAMNNSSLATPPSMSSNRNNSIFGDRPAWEPEYLQVVSAIADALPPLMMSSRPDVFASPEEVMSKNTIAMYHIELSPEGRLAPLFLRGWLNLEEDLARGFACDVLEVDHVELGFFSYIGSRVICSREDDVKTLPFAGWRLAASDDHSRKLHTCYMFIDAPHQKLPKTLVIHDVYHRGLYKEDVVTTVTVLGDFPQFAKVQVWSLTPPSSRRAEAKVGSAIASMTKELLDHCGFPEADDEELAQLLAEKKSIQLSRSKEEISPAASATDSVGTSYANPEELKKEKKSTIGSMAVDMTKSLISAPLTATKAMTNLVSSAAGAAMSSQIDPKFIEWFPEIGATESLLETYNCALLEKSLLKQGVVFVSKHWLCFHGTVLSATFKVNFDDVEAIKKAKTAKIFDNAIEIETMHDGTYFLSSFIQRDVAFTTIYNAWRQSGN